MARAKDRTSDNTTQNSQTARALLKSFVERIARLEDEKAEIASDIKDVKAEAVSHGWDRKVIAQMVRELRMDESDRAAQREFEALCEVYRASLGMLDGTPLGDDARRRFNEATTSQQDGEESDGGEEDAENATAEAPVSETPDAPAGAMSQEELDRAEGAGSAAAASGQSVFANPFVAGDPRRARWDQGWCGHTGSDGMDIPRAWRRAEKKADANKQGEQRAAA